MRSFSEIEYLFKHVEFFIIQLFNLSARKCDFQHKFLRIYFFIVNIFFSFRFTFIIQNLTFRDPRDLDIEHMRTGSGSSQTGSAFETYDKSSPLTSFGKNEVNRSPGQQGVDVKTMSRSVYILYVKTIQANKR